MKRNSVHQILCSTLAGPAALLLLGALMTVVAGCGAGKKSVTPAVSQNVIAPAAVQHLSRDIANGSFIVEPGQYKSFKIAVDPGMANPLLAGSFQATGGNNDVEVLLLDEMQFLNWQNNHRANTLYSSGRVTAEKIKVTLPDDPGTYYLIFSNKFSYMRNKAIAADVKLQYDSSQASSN